MGADRARGEVDRGRTSSGGQISPGVARDLSELARAMQADLDPDAVMQRIVDAAVAEIDGASDAGITQLGAGGRLSSPVHTSARAARVGRAEAEAGEGPCVDTSRQEITIRSDDLGSDERWPGFGHRAAQEGVRSILSFQLFVEADGMGALNVYADTAGAFDEEAENTGLLLAAHAAVGLWGSRKQANLRIALDSRDVIGQAKGVLMERFKIGPIEAFDLLVAASQKTHRKLRQIADELAETGQLRLD